MVPSRAQKIYKVTNEHQISSQQREIIKLSGTLVNLFYLQVHATKYFQKLKLNHGLLYTWTEDWIIIFLNSISAKLAKYGFTIICRFLYYMNFTKLEGCSSKIEPVLPISILIFKWVWQAQIYSHTLQILVNDRS